MEYRTFTFCGQTRYRCPYCDFDSYSEIEVNRHIKAFHSVSASSMPLILDNHGQPVVRDEEE